MEHELELPSWLTNALKSAVVPPRLKNAKKKCPDVGDIYLVTPGQLELGTNRLCVVLELDSSMETARVALVTNETEYACDWDIRMNRDELQLPYELMVECDIVSSVWWAQLITRIGTIPSAVWSGLVVAATSGDFSAVGESRRGTAIHGPSDPRWTFREHELDALQALSAECMSRLIDGLVLDPGLICALADASREEQAAIAAAISERAMVETVTMDPGSLDFLLSNAELIDSDSWSALQGIIESASGADVSEWSPLSTFEVTSLVSRNPASRSSGMRDALNSLLTKAVRENRSVTHLLTRREEWAAHSAVVRLESGPNPNVLIAEMLR